MSLANKNINFEISTNTIIKILIVIFALWLLYLIREVIVILFFVVILVSILEPIVTWLRNKKIPKIVAVALIYCILISFIGLIVLLLIPPISDQVEHLSKTFPLYWERISADFTNFNYILEQYGIAENIQTFIDSIKIQISGSEGVFAKVSSLVTGFISLVVIFVITFYMLVEENAVKKVLKSVIPHQSLPYAYQLVNKIQDKLGLWLRAQIILSFIIFAFVYFALAVSGVKYALILAIIAGLFEFVPYLGPLLAGFIAIVLTFLQSPLMALWVLILYIIIQFFENHLFVPMVMRQTVGLNPIISITALLIGGRLGGVIGVILAIPVATVLMVLIEEIFTFKKQAETKLEN